MQTKKTISFLLKIGIVAFAIFFLFEQLTTKTATDQFKQTDIIEQLKDNYFTILIVFIIH